MARYTGPRSKVARKLGEAIYGADKNFEKRSYPPGQHGLSRKRKKASQYGIQLKEKQKAKYTYGLLERQFRNVFHKATSKKGVTGEVLLQLLESRLDNVVYRMGVSPTRAGARQLVTHRHITVNGAVVNVPSFRLKPGDIVGIRERSKSMEVITSSLSEPRHKKYSWIEWDNSLMAGKFLNVPERDDIPENITEHLIVELYSK